jgi:hypothetical protein
VERTILDVKMLHELREFMERYIGDVKILC